ncbi:hypothetical protein DFH11DRAFT_1621401 [Phellopilus nigrolimitatus]|nr:hypothetical protein DFH11DRAFT_1621401 [Phellopilus nigrolimitatus]
MSTVIGLAGPALLSLLQDIIVSKRKSMGTLSSLLFISITSSFIGIKLTYEVLLTTLRVDDKKSDVDSSKRMTPRNMTDWMGYKSPTFFAHVSVFSFIASTVLAMLETIDETSIIISMTAFFILLTLYAASRVILYNSGRRGRSLSIREKT